MDPHRKYVLFVATGVGLGHLLGALLNSAYYAWRTGRALAIDMREFHYVSGDKHAGFFEHFSLDRPPDLEVIADLATIDRLRQDDDLHFLKLETDRLNVDQPFPERVLLIPCLVPGEPYPISAKRNDVPFRINLRGKLLDAWRTVMRRPEWSGPVIGLHYRSVVGEITERMSKAITPDYEERYRAVKDNYIATALKAAADAGYSNPAFLVTSDDMEFVTYVRERLPNAFSLVTRLPDQEWAAWVRAHGHDFNIMSEAVNDLWCLSACDHLVHFRSGFSHFAILNSTKLDETTTHYVHVPALKEILDSLGPEEAVAWARAAVRKANIRHLQQRYLFDWLADALDRVGQTEAAARERQRAQWHWECHHHPVVDNPERPLVQERGRRGDQGGYLEVAQRAVQELPGNPYWLSGYGGSVSTVLLRMGRAQEAIAPARKALEIEPEDPFLYESLATILLFAGDPQEAERVIRQSIAFDNDIGSFHSVLGESLMRQRRPREAIDTYREAVRLEPDDPHLVRKLGMSLLRAGDLTAAEVTFRQAIPMRSEAGPHIELSDALARQGRLPEAIAAVEAAVALEPTNPHWHNRLAHVLLQTGRLAEAEAAARAAIAHDSGRSAFQDTLALILQRQGRNEEALEAMQQPAELEPQDAQLRLRMARTLLGQGQFAEAEAAAGQAAELQPDMVEAYDLLSVIMERQKRPAEAAAAAQRAAALVPQDSGRQQRLAVTLIHADDFTGAERAAREAMRLAAGQPTFHAHHLLGIAFERQGRMQEASAAARKASDLEPDNPALLGRLAAMLRAADRVEEAEFAARKAVSLQPDAEPLQRLLAAIIDQRRTLAQSAQEPAATNAPPTGQLSREPEAAEPQQETANANASPSEALAEDARLALEHAAPGEP